MSPRPPHSTVGSRPQHRAPHATDAERAGVLQGRAGPRPSYRFALALLAAVALALALAAGSPHAHAEDASAGDGPQAEDEGGEPGAGAAGDGGGPADQDRQVFDFDAIDIGGQLRTPQLLYFLDRARDELRQASLERRSFLPEMMRSVDEESL